MSEQKPPKIEFPCPNYPIKAMGLANEAYYDFVLQVMEAHAPGFDRDKVKVQGSSKGRFQSVTVFIEATGEAQLVAIFEDLKKNSATRMVI